MASMDELDNISTLFNNDSLNTTDMPHWHKILERVNVAFYLFICIVGLTGNGLVIYVVLIYAKMKTVTNMYILSLALSDVLFLIMLPLTVTTIIAKHWVFGFAMCKIYFILSAINIFGGAFNLCVMSADRYMAVCHPIRSMKYRTPKIALILCIIVWVSSFLVMLPVIMYTTTMDHHKFEGKFSCKIEWPKDQIITAAKAFISYSFILGFAIPVSLISVFYMLVILRLRHVGSAKKSTENRRCHGRVTRLVLTVIAVYVVCWLPYWTFQVHHIVHDVKIVSESMILLFNGFTILSYANSMMNPFLYAFLSDNFRQSFVKAFKCISFFDMSRSVCKENSVFPRTSQTTTRACASAAAPEERIELYSKDNNSIYDPPMADQEAGDVLQDDNGFLKPPVHL